MKENTESEIEWRNDTTVRDKMTEKYTGERKLHDKIKYKNSLELKLKYTRQI